MTYARIALLFGLLALLACTKAVKPLPDKNTNWLRACDADAECGSELACLCGACTKACKSDSQCGDAAPGAKCVAAGDPSVEAICGIRLKEPGVCTAACKRDSDCDSQADGLRCQAGLCVPVAAPTCDPEEKCAGFDCIAGFTAHAACDAKGGVQCSCVPVEPQTCKPGDVIAKICGMACPGLNETAFATCGSDGHYGPCECQNPRCGPATDCAAGSVCYGSKCLEAANACVAISCEAGAECIDGLCLRVLADGLSSPGDMGIGDDGDLYFVNHGTYDEEGQFNFDGMLAKVPLAGGRYIRLREDLNEIGRAVFVGDAAYWFNVKDGVSFQVTGRLFDSDEPTNIFLADHAQSPLVVDADAFYWLERKDPNGPVELMRASRAVLQPEPTSLLALSEPATALALNGDRLYWGSTDSGLWSANKDGSAVAQVLKSSAELRGPAVFAVDLSAVYWSWTSESQNVGLGLFAPDPDVKLSLTGGMNARLGDALALDDTHVFWVQATSGDPQYSLVRTSKVPFSTETLWRSAELNAATKVLIHGDFLYVSTLGASGQGKILRIARPRM
jgi:hypothetical protein